MSKPKRDIRILLIQARDEHDILIQEQQCFIERCAIREDQLITINILDQTADNIEAITLQEYDALMIGGSGAYSAANDYPWMNALLSLVVRANALSFPTFGSCWGHQIIARALGGTVAYDRELTEMGCHTIYLNDTGKQDILFTDFPEQFKANMGHHDRVTVLPQGGIDLAFSKTQPHQAFRIKNKPIYGTQFHSELNAERERERLIAYRPYYTEVETEELFQQILEDLAETTEVDGLLEKFLDIYVANGL
ncbi:MAG: type 1 glutamine amidotransferase [Rhodothermaceae bacterium]|nr:type 1 glutamine amidotransferase [Rhodothermaceae bacterium]